MPDRSPTLAAAALLALGVLAVWIVVTIPAVSLWAGLAATGLMLWVGWLWQSQARRECARAADLEARLRAVLRAAGVPDAKPQDAERAVRERVTGLAEDGRWLRAVLGGVEVPVLALDERGVVVEANRAASALLAPGSSGRLVGQPLVQLLPDARALTVLREAGAGRAGRAQAKLLTGDGPRIVEVAAEPAEGGPSEPATGPAVVVTLRDVTEQATALQLKTDFVANASHELRTPLASIRSAAETLGEIDPDDDAIREKLVSTIAANAERLEELSRDLIDLSSLESPEAEVSLAEVDLAEVAADLRELFADACVQRRVTLAFELDERLSTLRTDARLVRLVLRNLIDNAIKFAYEDSQVRVRGSVTPGGEHGSSGARLEVIDRGIGIPLAQQPRVFERFYQADAARTGPSRRRGTGLGLAIVKHALRALNGTIRVESVWQQGTTMTVELPGCLDECPGGPTVHRPGRTPG